MKQTRWHLIARAFLLMPGLLACVWWVGEEYQVIYTAAAPIYVSPGEVSNQALEELSNIQTSLYSETKDFYQPLAQQEESELVDDFSKKLEETLLSQLGFLSSLPIHQACLENRNKNFIDGIYSDLPAKNDALGIIPYGPGYEFYSTRDSWDCKNVILSTLRKSEVRLEQAYTVYTTKTQNKTSSESQEEKIYLLSYFLDTSETRLVIKLNLWALSALYLLVTVAISYPYFQLLKILGFLFRNEISS